MDVKITLSNIIISDTATGREVVKLPLAKYDTIELLYLREIYKTLFDCCISTIQAAELYDAMEQINDMITTKLNDSGFGLAVDKVV